MIQETILTYTLTPIGPVIGKSQFIPRLTGLYIAVTARSYFTFYRVTQILYIGKTLDNKPNRGLFGRVSDHVDQDHDKWKREYHIAPDEDIIYFFIPITGTHAKIVPALEAALINYFKPCANTQYKDYISSSLRLLKTIKIQWPEFLGTSIIYPTLLSYKNSV